MPNPKKEHRDITAFLDCYEGYRDCQLIRQDPPEPDFCIETENGLVGIEHTTLMKKKSLNGVDPIINQNEADIIMNKAEKLFNQHSNIKLTVTASFIDDYGSSKNNPKFLSKDDRTSLSNFIANTVLNNTPSDKERIKFDKRDYFSVDKILPEQIESLRIFNTNYLDSSCWSVISSHWVPDPIKGSNFYSLLERKNQKPKNYLKPYFEKWLIFSCDKFNINTDFSFDNFKIEPVQSEFNRVFIFRKAENVIHEINLR